jgi:hypothetical protein
MVTLSVTRSRVAAVLNGTASLLKVEGWDPLQNPVMTAIDRAAGYVPGKGSRDAEQTTLDAWTVLSNHLDVSSVGQWEREPGRTQLQVLAALEGAAAKAVAVS